MFTCLPLDGTGYKLQRRIYEQFRAIKSVIASTCISSDVCLPIYTIETFYVIKPTQLSAYAIKYNLKFKKIMPDEYSLLI